MAAKELRVVRDAKFTGTFTREQIDRAIRIVEGGQATSGEARRDSRVASHPPKNTAAAKH